MNIIDIATRLFQPGDIYTLIEKLKLKAISILINSLLAVTYSISYARCENAISCIGKISISV
jgi:hypothetical protein